MSEGNGQQKDRPTNLVPFKSGSEWNGNAGGRPKGKTLRSALREALKGNTVWGTPIPLGLTAKEAVAQSWVREAIKGSASHLQQMRECLGEEMTAQLDEAVRGIVFEIVDNHRDAPKPVEGADDPPGPATDEKADVVKECEDDDEPGEIGSASVSK